MAETDVQRELLHQQIAMCPTGIQGLDEITGGGLPRGRPTLVCGGAGYGKTLLGMKFMVRGAATLMDSGAFNQRKPRAGPPGRGKVPVGTRTC